jgi:hypothetical protein
VGSQQDNIHIRIQQRNGRKTLTTLQGVPSSVYLYLYTALTSSELTGVQPSSLRLQEALEGFQEGTL